MTGRASGVRAEGTADARARAAEGGTALASGSSVNAILTKPVDSKRNKPGDAVSARTMQDARTEDGTTIPKGSLLAGHIARARAHGEGEAASSVAIVFDKAVTRDGREIPLRNVAIQAVAAAEGSAGAGRGRRRDDERPRGKGMGAGAAGTRGGVGGGLVGRTSNAVGGTLGSGVSGITGRAGSLAATGAGALQASPSASGGLDASGRLMSHSTGVLAARRESPSGASDAVAGTLVTSRGQSVHLDSGTRLLLSPPAGTSEQAATRAATCAQAGAAGETAAPAAASGQGAGQASARTSGGGEASERTGGESDAPAGRGTDRP